MIEYQRDQQQTIPDSQVKIVGVGGAGLNMMDRVALDGVQGVELLALAADARTLASSIAQEKVQLGAQLTMGLGCGGDPDLGLRAAQEQQTEIRDSLRERSMVFICAGLGGGTGSGAAPLVARIAREMGAFVVVFATMPFEFEGKRRRDQAEVALSELSLIANALITFENSRMGELVLAAQGIHEAFAAGDRMISQSIQAVTRLVVRPGLINIGLDELVSSLRATRSRCLFGSGMASGENRSQAALQNALTSPLLDKGRLLKNAKTALVHVCGGENVTLFEIELLMRELSKQVSDDAHILFGAAVDSSMGDSLSVTIISALPENSGGETLAPVVVAVVEPKPEPEPAPEFAEVEIEKPRFAAGGERAADFVVEEELELLDAEGSELSNENTYTPSSNANTADSKGSQYDFKEPTTALSSAESAALETKELKLSGAELGTDELSIFEAMGNDLGDDTIEDAVRQNALDKGSQVELELDGCPRGKFEGEAPNLIDGEDLDIPPYLRNKM